LLVLFVVFIAGVSLGGTRIRVTVATFEALLVLVARTLEPKPRQWRAGGRRESERDDKCKA
jgi:hypothetical protein